jgi:DNA-binding CsgD family transcriptional regulator
VTIRSDNTRLGARAFEFALAAASLRTMTQLAAAVDAAIAPVGMTAAASGVVSGPKAASANPFHFQNWPAPWVQLYIAEDFLLADPIPRWARNSGQPLTWTALIKALPDKDRGRKVIKTAARFGYTEGMIVPMRTRDNSLGLISMGGGRTALTVGEQAFLVSVGRAAFEAADRIENKGAAGQASPIFSMREIECLTLLVRGHSDTEIGKLLGMTIRTVRFHLSNAREKFPATSRTHLAALAVAQGYVVL